MEDKINEFEFEDGLPISPTTGEIAYVKPALARLIRLRASRSGRTFNEIVNKTLIQKFGNPENTKSWLFAADGDGEKKEVSRDTLKIGGEA